MPFCRRRSVWINGRFQKASVKNQCPLHAIDGCWAAEERERQRTPVYCEKWLPPLFVLAFLDLFVFSRTALCFYFLFIALFARLSFCLFVESYAPLIPIYRKRVTFKLYLDTFIELLFCIPLFFCILGDHSTDCSELQLWTLVWGQYIIELTESSKCVCVALMLKSLIPYILYISWCISSRWSNQEMDFFTFTRGRHIK